MNTRRLTAAAAVFALLGAGAGGAVAAKGGNGDTAGTGGKRERYGSDERVCAENGTTGEKRTITYNGVLEMWPPNHKYRTGSITAKDSDGGNVTLVTTGTHDEYLEDGTELNGAGNTDNDTDIQPVDGAMGDGEATTTHRLRGERSGRGDGRTYTLTAVATWEDGSTCEEEFTVTVPHDQGQGSGKPAAIKVTQFRVF